MRVRAAALLIVTATTLSAQSPRQINGHGNPILADGSFYSADPAPIVVGDTLYILAGRDEAPSAVNDFVMKEWQIFATTDVASHHWQHYPAILRPADVFAWASPDHAYAGQIIQGPDHRFYLYAPVQQSNSTNQDPFAIGVAVSSSPLGPWKDAHPGGPIISQSIPEPNTIQNIDPTAMLNDDGRVYLYWGTFGQLRGMELEPDMVTPKGHAITVNSLDGFFEAPWLMKRNGTYYMIYAGNKAGPHSECTPAVYHACIAYGTSSSPLGPWTYRGVVLAPVSSTTSHPGAIEFKGKWYLVYHTADAANGGHFRRSVAMDEMKWDDSVTPARILEVTPTRAPAPPPPPTRNIAPAAHASASNEPIPVQYWIAALNDGIVRANPLPPDMWASWTPHNPPSQWIQYTWPNAVKLNASRILFWSDHPAGASEGIAPPAAWHLEYLTGNQWRRIEPAGGYPVSAAARSTATSWITVNFSPIETTSLRAVFEASGTARQHAAVAVQEWEALTPK